MKTFTNQAAQGDLLITKIDALPDGVKELSPEKGEYVLAHSETGHNHAVKAQQGIAFYANDNNPFVAYLVVDNTKNKTQAFVEHQRDFDTHEGIQFDNGIFEIRRQREYTPEGFRLAAD